MKIRINHNTEHLQVEADKSIEEMLKFCKKEIERYYQKEHNTLEINGKEYVCNIDIRIDAEEIKKDIEI